MALSGCLTGCRIWDRVCPSVQSAGHSFQGLFPPHCLSSPSDGWGCLCAGDVPGGRQKGRGGLGPLDWAKGVSPAQPSSLLFLLQQQGWVSGACVSGGRLAASLPGSGKTGPPHVSLFRSLFFSGLRSLSHSLVCSLGQTPSASPGGESGERQVTVAAAFHSSLLYASISPSPPRQQHTLVFYSLFFLKPSVTFSSSIPPISLPPT